MSYPVLAQITAAPGKDNEVRKILSELAKPSRAESGCERYDLFESTDRPGAFKVVEQWEGEEAFKAHQETPHFKEAIGALGDLLASPPEMDTLTVVS